MKMRLTDSKIRRLKPPPSGRIQIAHEPLPGLVLRVTARGARSWSFVYRLRGSTKLRRKTLGPWPTLGLGDASRLAHEFKLALLEGRDPDSEQRAAQTFRQVAERYLQIRTSELASASLIRGVFENHLYPAWGNLPVDEISRSDVHTLIDQFVQRGSLGTAREVRKRASAFFTWAHDRELIATNPAYRLQRDELGKTSRSRVLSDEEICALWHATGEMAYPWGTCWRLVLLTGSRRSEIARTKWTEIDPKERALVIPPERHKSRRGHFVPFSGLAWDLVQSCPRFIDPESFVFSTTHGRKPINCFNKAKGRLDARMAELLGRDLVPWQTRDLRRTHRTRLSSLGVPREVAEAAQGRAAPALVATYDQHDFAAEVREAQEKLAARIWEIVAGTADRIEPPLPELRN